MATSDTHTHKAELSTEGLTKGIPEPTVKPMTYSESEIAALTRAAARVREYADVYYKRWGFPVRVYMLNGFLAKMVGSRIKVAEARQWAIDRGYIETGFTLSGAEYVLPVNHGIPPEDLMQALWKLDTVLRQKREEPDPEVSDKENQIRLRHRRRLRQPLFAYELEEIEKLVAQQTALTARIADWMVRLRAEQEKQLLKHKKKRK